MPRGNAYAFGPFLLDSEARRLMKAGEPVPLSGRQLDLLCALVSSAPAVVGKDDLIRVVWRDVAVTDNSLEQAISTLRRLLSPGAPQQYIRTEARRGYRFADPVTRVATRQSDRALDALLAPHRAWLEGRAALETLDRSRVVEARAVFEDVLRRAPDEAPVHVGLANAHAMLFETTRADRLPDLDSIASAAHHAREACRLDPDYGEAWATLGFVLERTGRHADALAAGRRAIALEPDNWRHHLRLAYTSWGEERLRCARKTLALLPGFPMAHWLAATVHVARGALTEAARELDDGLASQAAPASTGRFSSVALHWLRGLLYLRAGDPVAAADQFERELADEASGQLYSREVCAATWYAIGAMRWRSGDQCCEHAFREAIERVPAHPLASAALAAIRGGRAVTIPGEPAIATPPSFDHVLAHAVSAVVAGDIASAARLVEQALESAPPSAGWVLPVDPLLQVHAEPEAWSRALSLLRSRAA